MRISRAVKLVAAFSFILALSGGSVADDKDRDRDADRDSLQLREQLKKDTGISDSDMSVISKELDEYARRTQDREQIRNLVRNSLDEGCRGECLAEVIDAMNDSVKSGMSPREAQTMVNESLRSEKRERKELSGKELGERVKRSVETRLRNMEQDSDRDKAMDSHNDKNRHGDGYRDGGAGKSNTGGGRR